MKTIIRIFTGLSLAASVAFLASCGGSSIDSTSNTPGSAFSFTPSVTQPTNRSAVKVAISTTAQRLYVTEGEKVLLATPVSVGKASTPTPLGTHRISSKTRNLPTLDDGPLPNPPPSYMQSAQVFADAEQGKMWNF